MWSLCGRHPIDLIQGKEFTSLPFCVTPDCKLLHRDLSMRKKVIMEVIGLSGNTVLELRQIKKVIQQKELFSDVTAEIKEPSVISILGASGQGKSTLLRIIGMLDSADEGTVRYRNRLTSESLPHTWRTRVCYIAQQSVMLPGTIEDNLRVVSQLHRQPFDRELAVQLLNAVRLEYLEWNKSAGDLSGGEKQRLALVRTMLLRPEVMLLDEVTASLDTQSKQAVEQLLTDWHKQEGSTLIWVTHDIGQARQTSSRIWFMGEGTLLEDSPSPVFFEHPATDGARAYLQVSAGAEERS
jgi:putative ABC transport system ATP-binding protein